MLEANKNKEVAGEIHLLAGCSTEVQFLYSFTVADEFLAAFESAT